jgi:hypothetical protein
MTNTFRSFALVGIILMGMTFSAMAATDDYNKTIASAGVQAGGGYFKLVEPTSVNCLYGTIYITNLSADAGQRAMYATVLAAEAGSRKIVRVEYNVDSTGTCTATLVEVGP